MLDSILTDQLKKPFTRVFPEEAMFLANATKEQFGTKGYKDLSYERLYESIRTAFAHPDSSRMQFALSKHEFPNVWDSYSQNITGPQKEKVIILPRRLIRTTRTAYEPWPVVRGAKEWEKARFERKVRGYDSNIVARDARDLLLEILQDAAIRNVNYALMGTFVIDNADEEGQYVLHDSKGKFIKNTRLPWIVVPGATPEQIKIIDSFCDKYQIPSKETVDRLSGKID